MNKMIQLINELNKASELYYNGKESFLTDEEFDFKLEELKKLEQEQKIIYTNSPTINVGAPILTELNKIQIKDKPMLSLDKVHSAKEIINFSDGYDLIASIKCDGLSVRLIYENTDLVSANTRGNGFEGSDITEHIKHFLNVPIKIAKTGTYIIDGEAIIYDNDFAIINKNEEFKNNRNTASGALSLLDTSIVDERRLSFIAWDVVKGGNEQYYHYNLEEAEKLGFTVVPALALDCTKIENEEINQINETLLNQAKEKGIPCDGIVWKINDIKAGNDKGQTAHHFLNAIAWKPHDEEYKTELLNIEFSMGRTGVLTPIAIFKPIEIDGTIVERASLHNVSVMKETLGLYPDLYQPIWVYKANMIIPQISRAVKNNVPHDHIIFAYDQWIPCPCCGKPIEFIESDTGVVNAICGNPLCEGKLENRIDHYLGKKGLDVKGISKATIGKLIDWGWIQKLIDIYSLDEYKESWINQSGFGIASVNKILDAIEKSKNNILLSDFISALGIPLVGKTIAKEITKYYITWSDFRNAVGGDWTEFEGFGPEISKSINNFDYTEADMIAEWLSFATPDSSIKEQILASAIKDKVFCTTGKLISGQFKNRDELKADIESYGGKLVGSVTSKTDYLITNTPDSGTSKNKEAQKLGVKIITENEYLQMRV